MADIAELHQEARELPFRQHNELISQLFTIACHLQQHPCHQLYHRPPDDRPERRRFLIDLKSSNTSLKRHSATPATSRQSAASTNMWSELSLIAAHQNCLMADRRQLPQPNRHWPRKTRTILAQLRTVTAESLFIALMESTRQSATIATTVVCRLMTPTTFSTALRSRPY